MTIPAIRSRLTDTGRVTVGLAWLLALAAPAAAAEPSSHWAFRPVVRPEVPAVQAGAWPHTPVDNFVLAKLEERGLEPSPPAEPSLLLRRAAMDLVGLPPDQEALARFTADHSDEAYGSVVEELLANPHHGERWGRHWLDAARYADSSGHEFDTKREIWRYRDWVIAAINSDMPYNQFVIEQFAGDLLAGATQEQRIATGFSCNALQEYGDLHEVAKDRVNAFGAAILGLTVACANCHDHMFDPITQEEYFQLYAFFNDAEDTLLDLSPPEQVAARDAAMRQIDTLKKELAIYQNGPDHDPLAWAAQLTGSEFRALPSDVRQAAIRVSSDRTPEQLELIRNHHASVLQAFQAGFEKRIDAWAASLDEEHRNRLAPETRTYLETPRQNRPEGRPPSLLAAFWEQDAGRKQRQELIDSLTANAPPTDTTPVLRERLDHPKTFVFIRGDHNNPGPEVQPGTPAVLPPLQVAGQRPTRLDLARWAVSPVNPLAARVIVNRIWQEYFGRGIVETSDDFGAQAPEPEHLALLDWLASELMDHQWSLKHVHRLITLSSAYRQSSRMRPELQEIDPTNSLLARQSRVRLDAEIIRDSALAASGLLNEQIGGPSVFPYQPEGVMTGRADGTPWVMSEGADRYRRGMYTHFWRLTPHPYKSLFDAPDAVESCTRRTRSNTPVQALTLLNDPTFVEAAASLGRRMADSMAEGADAERLTWGVKECLCRLPSNQELATLSSLLDQQRVAFESDPERARAITGVDDAARATSLAAWTSVARVLLNLDEFITRE